MRTRADLAEREGNFEEAGRLRYGDMPALERQIREAEAADDAAEQTAGEPMIAERSAPRDRRGRGLLDRHPRGQAPPG